MAAAADHPGRVSVGGSRRPAAARRVQSADVDQAGPGGEVDVEGDADQLALGDCSNCQLASPQRSGIIVFTIVFLASQQRFQFSIIDRKRSRCRNITPAAEPPADIDST